MGFSLVSILGGSQASYPGAFCEDTLVVGTLQADQNNFAPNGGGGPLNYTNASVWDITPLGGSISITGMKGGVKGRRVTIMNSSPDWNLVIAQEDAGSDAVNQFNFGITIEPTRAIVVQYSGILSKWVLVGSGTSASQIQGASIITDTDEWDGAQVSAGNGVEGVSGGAALITGGFASTGNGGNVTIATGLSGAGAAFNGQLNIQLGNDIALTLDDNGASWAATVKQGFFGAAPVVKQSITGATTQLQVDSIVAALVAFGLVSDDR